MRISACYDSAASYGVERRENAWLNDLDLYLGSCFGMLGGNPRAAVWFCDVNNDYSIGRNIVITKPPLSPTAWDFSFREENRDAMIYWLTYQRIARVMASARATTLQRPELECDWRSYYENHLYGPSGAEMNVTLYPLSRSAEMLNGWIKCAFSSGARISVRKYVDLCRNGLRFKFINSLRSRLMPKVVVCLGDSARREFVRAFDLDGVGMREHVLKPADQERVIHSSVKDGTTWVFCPALAGVSGLCSNVFLDELGKLISGMLEPSDFTDTLYQAR